MPLPPLKNGAGAFCIRVCPSVSEPVRPKNLVNTIFQKINEWSFAQFWPQMYLGL